MLIASKYFAHLFNLLEQDLQINDIQEQTILPTQIIKYFRSKAYIKNLDVLVKIYKEHSNDINK